MPMIRDGLMEYYFIVVQEFSKMKRRIERIYKVIPNTASNMIVIVMLHSTPKQIRISRDYVYSMANEKKSRDGSWLTDWVGPTVAGQQFVSPKIMFANLIVLFNKSCWRYGAMFDE